MTAPAPSGPATVGHDTFVTARDGLRLYVRHYAASGGTRRPADGRHRAPRPAVCLPGLTRNGRDFDRLARALATDETAPRDVYTLDYRGRGRSGFDGDWRNYAVPIEMLDVVDTLTALGLHDVAVVGTSRGGLIAMVMAAAQPSTIGAVVLNDIGPVIEAEGLLRIAGYVGRAPLPTTWADAEKLVRDLFQKQFTAVPDGDWIEIARQLFNEKDGRPAPGYDARVARSLSALDGPIPALWPQFEALKRVPVMVVRGANTDLLSEATVAEMARRHPRLTAVTVPGEGHAPLLRDQPTIAAIARFLAKADGDTHATPATARTGSGAA